ncbi:HAD family phosphatase [Paenarthrobacter sp. Z7-10]|uniref:HAD family hydrolase n=1 Tax=Paenarthrobacter sp. Z7-10 TaxID=2787635 RepID=UPI0022A9D5FC|nr:HAD family phosphatase [Paenarthrobacter sp. Z7-10]MCZ2404181.1 HAD family phosphatase [Paenarthrobacter sp. Z7-10]
MNSLAPSSVQTSPATSPEGLNPGADYPLKAVLWDMDGTLVDTEPYWIDAEFALVEAHGGNWSHGQALTLVGQSLVFSSHVLQDAGVALDSRTIIYTLTTEVIRRVRQEVPWRPGARELLHELVEQGVRCALVTMSEGPLAAEVVASLPQPYFEFMITGDLVTHGKPDPEPYLTAVQRLRLEDPSLSIDDCVALEDSVPGVASALASGVITVGIPHTVALPADGGYTVWPSLADRMVADLQQLVAVRHGAVAAAPECAK